MQMPKLLKPFHTACVGVNISDLLIIVDYVQGNIRIYAPDREIAVITDSAVLSEVVMLIKESLGNVAPRFFKGQRATIKFIESEGELLTQLEIIDAIKAVC